MMTDSNKYFDDEMPKPTLEQEQAIRQSGDALSEITPEMKAALESEWDAFAKMDHHYSGEDEMPSRVFIDHGGDSGSISKSRKHDAPLGDLF